MAYDGRQVANFILDLCEQRGQSITNLSLQKVAYFCHVWSLIERGRPLVRHSFEAWEYGPVLPYLYREFREFGSSPITRRAHKLNPNTGEVQIVETDFDHTTREFLERIIEFYGRLRPTDLVEMSHVSGGPWASVWNHKGNVNPGMKISNIEIEKFYSKTPRPFLKH